MIVLVKSIEEKPTKSGESTYLEVIGTNIKTQKEGKTRVFDDLKEKWEIIQPNKMIDFSMKKNGQYWNVVDIKIATETPPPVQPPIPEAGNPPKAETPPAMSKNRSIARLNGLNNACLLISNGMYPADCVGLLAYQFEKYSVGELDATKLDANMKAILNRQPKEK